MRFNSRFVLALLTALPSAFAAINGKCSYGKKGICIGTGTCGKYGGKTSNGNCPNDPNDVKCCESIPCKADGLSGSCMFTSECANIGGTTYSGLCPGGSDFKCCIKKTSITGVGSKCSDQGINGKCIDINKSKCGTTLVTGRCPGAANVKCCLDKNPPKPTGLLAKAQKAADYARTHAHPKSTGWCAAYVADALLASGFSFTRQASAYQYHTNGILKNIGFRLQSSKPNPLKKGDVAVHGSNGSHPHGHIQIYDGSKWYSDFVQNSEHVYASNEPPLYYYRI